MPDFDIKKASERINKIKNSQKNRKSRIESRPKRWKEEIYNKLQVLKTLIVSKLKAKKGEFGSNNPVTLTNGQIQVPQDLIIDAKGSKISIKDSNPSNLNPTLELKSDYDGAYGPVFNVKHNTTSPADLDIPFFLNVYGKDSDGNDTIYGQIYVQATHATTNSEDGGMTLSVISHGNMRNGLLITGDSDANANVSLAYGVNSLTTINGDLDIDGDMITTAGNIELATGGSGNVTIDAAGDIALEAAGGDITMDAPLTITNTTTPQLKLIDTSGEYAQMAVTGTGDLTITTVGSGTTDSDINLTADGNINLSIAAGELIATSGLAASWAFNHANRRFRLYGSDGGTDYLEFASQANGVSRIKTIDASAGTDAPLFLPDLMVYPSCSTHLLLLWQVMNLVLQIVHMQG